MLPFLIGRTEMRPVLVISLLLLASFSISLPLTEADDQGAGALDLSSIYWPMIGRDHGHSNMGEMAVRGILEPVIKWSNDTDSLGSVSGDMTSNILFDEVSQYPVNGLVESNSTHLRIRDGETGELIWEMDARKIEGRAANRLNVAPALADVDSDDRLEIVCVIYYLNQFQVSLFEPIIQRNSTGFHWSTNNYFDERIWLSISANINVIGEDILPESSPMLRDLSGDNVEDVLVGSGNTIYSFFGNNGTLDWFLEIGPLGEDVSTCAFYDGAGSTKRIVVNSLTTTGQNLRTTVVSMEGDHLKNVTRALGSPLPYQYTGLIPMPVIGDVTGDGSLDILVTYPSRPGSGSIVVYSYSLVEEATITGILGTMESAPALGDMDDDGDMEILVHSRYATTSFWIRMICYDIIDDAGDPIPQAVWTRDGSIDLNTRLFTSPLVCDLNEDGLPDAVFTGNGWMYGVSAGGRIIWNLTINDQPGGTQGVIGDLGRDDFTDIYVDGRLISQQVIDLSVKLPWSSNIYLGTPDPVDGRTTNINCIVQNQGTSPARNVELTFLDSLGTGEPSIIGTTTIPEISTTFEATIPWTPDGAGNHTITVVIDPNQTLIETNEDNNEGYNFFNVEEAFGDLTVSDIKFARGDDEEVMAKRLVEGDPSKIIVQVTNIGEKSMDGARVSVTVNGSAIPDGSNVQVGKVEVGEIVNVSIPWTPDDVPETTLGTEFVIEAAIDTSGLDDLDTSNNFGSNSTRVKSKEPIAGFDIRGTVFDPEESPEDDVTITATNLRTSDTLEDDSNANGAFSIFVPQSDYYDADEIRLYANKGSMWAETLIKIYSEDGTSDIDLNLSDTPTLSLRVTFDGPSEIEVVPGQEYGIRFQVENNGNVDGNLSIDKEVSGNTSVSSGDIVLSPTNLQLGPGQVEDIQLTFTMPTGELPDKELGVLITGSMDWNGSNVQDSLGLTFIVGRSNKVYHEFRGEKNITLSANGIEPVSFPVYLLNQGNVDISYNLSVDDELADFSDLIDPQGILGPSDSVLAEVMITFDGSDDRLRGDITLRTSGEPSILSWRVTIDLEFPNLAADDIISLSDPNMVLGDTVTLLGIVRNDGNVDVAEAYCAFYEGDTLIGGSTVEDLRPGEDVVIDSVRWTPDGIGDRDIRFEVDPEGQLSEEDEDDNSATRSFSFYPDLSISNVDVEPGSVVYDGEVTVKVTVKNSGNADIKRGFDLEIRSGSATGEVLASQEYDVDISAGGSDLEEVGLIFNAPAEEGVFEIFIKVTTIGEEERSLSNNEFLSSVEISPKPSEGMDLTIIGIVIAIVVVLILGIGIYLWRFGLPSSPPPEEEEQVEENPPMEQGIGEEMVKETEDEEGPVLEMSLEPPSPEEVPVEPVEETEEVVVAEVVEAAEEPVEDAEIPLQDDQEEELIPEV